MLHSTSARFRFMKTKVKKKKKKKTLTISGCFPAYFIDTEGGCLLLRDVGFLV